VNEWGSHTPLGRQDIVRARSRNPPFALHRGLSVILRPFCHSERSEESDFLEYLVRRSQIPHPDESGFGMTRLMLPRIGRPNKTPLLNEKAHCAIVRSRVVSSQEEGLRHGEEPFDSAQDRLRDVAISSLSMAGTEIATLHFVPLAMTCLAAGSLNSPPISPRERKRPL